MRLKLKTAPAKEPITLEEARLHLKVDSADDNTLISDLITTARMLIEKETKRAFITQIWQMFLDTAPHVIEIPKPPLQSVESITVIDTDGSESLIDDDDYMVDTSENSPGRIMPKIGYIWPYHRGFASFIIEFKVGYGDNATNVPKDIRDEILRLVAHLYQNREDGGIPDSIKKALFPYKILGF